MTFFKHRKYMIHRLDIILLAGVIALLTVLSGCGPEEKNTQSVSARTYHYSKDNLSLDMTLDRQEMNAAENIQVKLVATAPEDWQIKFPDMQDKAGDFVVDGKPLLSSSVSDSGKEIIRRYEITLSPFLAGEYRLLPLKVSFHDQTGNKNIELVTDEIIVRVNSVLEKDAEHTLKDIAGVRDLQKDYLYWYISAAAGLLLLFIAGLLVLRKYLRYRALLREIRYPHELAFERLRELEKSGLIEKGRFAQFYTEVTDILRHYINMRFEIKAEESTTEEFLHYLSRDGELLREHKELLRTFLVHCDLVKFARVNPAKDECGDIMQSCRNFIEQTKRDNIRQQEII